MSDNNNKIVLYIDGTLPWDNLPGDRARQWSILLILALLSLLLIMMIEATPRVAKDRFSEKEATNRLAKPVLARNKAADPPRPPPPGEKPAEGEEETTAEQPKEEAKAKDVETGGACHLRETQACYMSNLMTENSILVA